MRATVIGFFGDNKKVMLYQYISFLLLFSWLGKKGY
jgi:hypothetical protein